MWRLTDRESWVRCSPRALSSLPNCGGVFDGRQPDRGCDRCEVCARLGERANGSHIALEVGWCNGRPYLRELSAAGPLVWVVLLGEQKGYRLLLLHRGSSLCRL